MQSKYSCCFLVSAIEILKMGSTDLIKGLIQKTFKKRLPSSDVLQVMSTLLYRTTDVKKAVGK